MIRSIPRADFESHYQSAMARVSNLAALAELLGYTKPGLCRVANYNKREPSQALKMAIRYIAKAKKLKLLTSDETATKIIDAGLTRYGNFGFFSPQDNVRVKAYAVLHLFWEEGIV